MVIKKEDKRLLPSKGPQTAPNSNPGETGEVPTPTKTPKAPGATELQTPPKTKKSPRSRPKPTTSTLGTPTLGLVIDHPQLGGLSIVGIRTPGAR